MLWAGMALSVYWIVMGWVVWGLNPGDGEIFRACPDPTWGPPSLLYNQYQSPSQE